MIDIHTHILPQMDDGSKSVLQSIAMLREEQKNGIETVVLTPHFYASQNDPQTFLKRREHSWNLLQSAVTDDLPRMLLGAEVRYFEGICQVEDLPQLCIEGSDLLLLEMPENKWSERMVRSVFELQEQYRMTVVLAHIERYLKFQPKATWEELREGGILMQVSASYFQDWRTRHAARRMLKRGEIHFLASDCHNMESRRPNLQTWMASDDQLWAERHFQHVNR